MSVKSSCSLALIVIFSLSSAFADDKRILFGAQTGSDGSTYEVGFCARAQDMNGDKPGHAFVLLQRVDRNNQIADFLTAGFSPLTTQIVHEHGIIRPENYSHPTQECLIAETNKELYEGIKSKIEDQTEVTFGDETFRLTRPYVVVLDDCVTFMQSVAKDFDLNVPSRINGLTPVAYVNALKDAN